MNEKDFNQLKEKVNTLEENNLKELKEKVEKLEKKRTSSLWLQFFIFPLILAAMGYYFQHVVKQSEKRIEQLKITQNIVNQVFTDTIYQRTVVIREILDEILENDKLSQKIQKSIDRHLKNKAINGTEEDLKNINSAVQTYATDSKTLQTTFTESPKIQEKLSKYQRAVAKEREAFTFLINGDFAAAKKAFKEVETIYPTFHEAYGIYNYLNKNTADFNNETAKKEMQLYIAKNFSWGAPKDLISRLK